MDFAVLPCRCRFTFPSKLLVLLFIATFLAFSPPSKADNAHDWQSIPIDTPLFFTYYLNTDSKTKDTQVTFDTALFRLSYAFDMGNGRVGSLQILQPFSHIDASFQGNAPGTVRNGNGDTDIGLAANVFGGPALTREQFARWTPETFLTAAFWVTAPTGRYDENSLLNTGENRWGFKPLLAFGHPFGQNWIEINAWAKFFTDNNHCAAHSTLKEKHRLGLEAHLSRNFTPSFWLRPICFISGRAKPK